ncbi:MAG: restriction endonuclease subunit S, partial [Candidatus Paceibacterota bacterium]
MTKNTTTVPEGWKETTLGEVAEIIGGGTPKTDVPEFWNGDIPW